MSTFAPWAWSPTRQRTIRLWGYAGTAPRGRIPTPLPLRWPDKSVWAVLDFTLDAGELLAGGGDTMSLTVNGVGGLSLLATFVQGGCATLWLAGGMADVDNRVDLTLATLSSRRVHRIVRLRTC